MVETSVNVNNSPIQDYVHPDDHTQPAYEMTPGVKPFTSLDMLTLRFAAAEARVFSLSHLLFLDTVYFFNEKF